MAGTINELGKGGSSSVISVAPAASTTLRKLTERNTHSEATVSPMEYGLAGLPSTAIKAAPELFGLANTPIRLNRLEACDVALAEAAPGSTAPNARATETTSATTGCCASTDTDGLVLATPLNLNAQNAALAAATAPIANVIERENQRFCAESAIVRLSWK